MRRQCEEKAAQGCPRKEKPCPKMEPVIFIIITY